MKKLTKRRKDTAKDILERYTIYLHDNKSIPVKPFELELQNVWDMGYQSIKDIMIDIVKNHREYTHLAAYYMEHSSTVGVVSEFQRPLAALYGLTSWYHDDTKEIKRQQYWENAFALISQFELGSPSSESSIIQVSSKITDNLIKKIAENPTLMRAIRPRHFEELIAELLDNFGYKVELTQVTRDGGCDIIAIASHDIADSKYLIECKRYKESNKVGIQPVRSLYGVVKSENATKGILVTTSTFTKPANEFLQSNKWELEGRDFNGVLDWLKKYQELRRN
ncbi:MAG: hypothetical protein DRH26_06655 [Deltaproteobacteria bacterium]|nr:MAG: hypothetical protein DRH26_06655 [Deltaproteobacteria bacterium]